MADFEKIKQEFTDLVFLDLEGRTKEEILLNIAKFAKKEGLIVDEQFLYQKFLKREQLGTTGFGNGLALPEACWIEMSRPYAFILCQTKGPVDYNSLDGNPVRIILASLGKDKDDLTRLRPMAQLVRLLKNNEFRDLFLKAKNVNAVYSLFEKMGKNAIK